MEKKGFFGKIILGVIIVVVLFLVFIGFSIYQAYSSVNIIKNEIIILKDNVKEVLDSKNCSKIDAVYESQEKIFFEVDYVCKNPLLKLAIKNIEAVPFKCEERDNLKESFDSEMKKFEEMCVRGNINSTNNSTNISIEELSEYYSELVDNDSFNANL